MAEFQCFSCFFYNCDCRILSGAKHHLHTETPMFDMCVLLHIKGMRSDLNLVECRLLNGPWSEIVLCAHKAKLSSEVTGNVALASLF